MSEGGLHVYTGGGKGKTTSAVGLSVRARSRGLRVLFAQFMKSVPGGELDLLGRLGIVVRRFEGVRSPLFHPEADPEELRREARAALETLAPLLGEYDLVVLDEFNHLLATDLITDEEARAFFEQRPAALHMVVTGRNAPDWLMGMADDVTVMREVKHSASGGMEARRGIEY